ncbi:MAG: hypothetical protein MUC43_17515 [Pirellula sp.]|nr:hypothetical protein [Pirellula sp.]
MNWPRSDSCGVSSFTDQEVTFLKQLWAAELLVHGCSVIIKKRLWPRLASRWDVFWDEKFARVDRGSCQVFVSFPKRAPGFLTVNYLRAGHETEYRTLAHAALLVEQIAIARGCQAIVCQVISQRVTPRLMHRWKYVPHAKSLGNGHFIRRLDC